VEPIKNVSILGAGALGAMYAVHFHTHEGFEVSLIASGERRERLLADGLVVNGTPYHFPVVDPLEATSPADLFLVALKHHHLAGALVGLDKLVGEGTLFVSVMNGLDSEDMIAAAYGREKVLYAIAVGMDAVREENRITYVNPGRIVFGEPTNETLNEALSPRVRRIQEAFDRAGIAHEIPPDMIRMLWWKFMINVGMNQATAVMGVSYGVMKTSPDAQALMEGLMREVIALAQAAGVDLSEDDLANWYKVLQTMAPKGKTSMLQDIEAGRKTEVEIFGGKVVELGRQHGIPTPINEVFTRILRVIEWRAEVGE
jgi:2-dehydropantoate 2-reductase